MSTSSPEDDRVTNEDLFRGEPAPEQTDESFERHDPLENEPPPPSAEPVVVPRWVQLVFVPLAALALWALARAAGPVLLLFIVAGVIALILNPLVAFLQRRRLPRGLAVLCVYLGFFTTLGGVGIVLATPVSNQVENFRQDLPSIVDSANESLADVQRYFDRNGINVAIKKQGETALETLQHSVEAGSGSIISFTGELLRSVVTAGFALILILVISVYFLLYGETIGSLVRRAMPKGDGTPEDDYPTRVQRGVSGYVRGQVLFSLTMGASAGLALYVFGVLGIFPDGKNYALVFGAFYGLMELVPFVGPVLGAAPAVLVALFQDPLTAIWVTLLFVALQQLEGHIVAPQIFGHTLRINPLLVIFALLVGGHTYGIVGALVALPIAAIVRETAVYLRRHLVLEPWGTPTPAAVAAAAADTPAPAVGGPLPLAARPADPASAEAEPEEDPRAADRMAGTASPGAPPTH
jgi:predicted PurR-regulated permease PerM